MFNTTQNHQVVESVDEFITFYFEVDVNYVRTITPNLLLYIFLSYEYIKLLGNWMGYTYINISCL